MKCSIVMGIFTAIFSLLSAYYWFKSSHCNLSNPPKKGDLIKASDISILYKGIHGAANLNKTAALFAGIASLLGALSVFFSIFE